MKKEYDVSILTFYDFKREYEYYVKRHSFGYGYRKNFLVKTFYLLFWFPLKLRSFLSKNEYDLVVSNAGDANLVSLITKKYLKRFTLWTYIRKNIFHKTHPYYGFRNLHRHADKRITLTEALSRKLPFDAVSLPNTIDIEEVKRLKDEPVEEEEIFEKKTILMIGRLAPQKNHKWFFDVFKTMDSDVNLLVICDGPLENELKEYAIGIENIYFLGRKNNVYKYLNKCDVFVLPSLFEGMPRVLMEALAVGSVSVVNDCETGPRELLGVGLDEKVTKVRKTKLGFLVPYNHKKEFKKAITKALKQNKIKPDKRYAIKNVAKQWSKEMKSWYDD